MVEEIKCPHCKGSINDGNHELKETADVNEGGITIRIPFLEIKSSKIKSGSTYLCKKTNRTFKILMEHKEGPVKYTMSPAKAPNLKDNRE